MEHLSPSVLVMLPPLLKGLSMGISTRILINFACSACNDLLSISRTLPSLLPMSFPASSDMYSNGNPHTWTQNGAWVNTMFDAVKPFHHRHRRSRLLSKLHGPLLSTHSNWHTYPNLNWNTLFPTSTIRKSEPIFHTVFIVILVMNISSASSLVSCSFWKLFKTSCSIDLRCTGNSSNQFGWVNQEKIPHEETKGEIDSF